MRNLVMVFVVMLLSVSIVEGFVYEMDQVDTSEGSFTIIVNGVEKEIQLSGVFEWLKQMKKEWLIKNNFSLKRPDQSKFSDEQKKRYRNLFDLMSKVYSGQVIMNVKLTPHIKGQRYIRPKVTFVNSIKSPSLSNRFWKNLKNSFGLSFFDLFETKTEKEHRLMGEKILGSIDFFKDGYHISDGEFLCNYHWRIYHILGIFKR